MSGASGASVTTPARNVDGHLLVALRGGVSLVVLHIAGGAVDVLQQEGQQAEVVLLRQRGVHGVELADVVFAVVGGEGDAGDDYFCAGDFEAGDHLA